MFDDYLKIVSFLRNRLKLSSHFFNSRQGHFEEAFNDVTNDLKGLCQASGIGSCQG